MAKQKSIDGANLQLALKQNNEKMKGYIDASHYDIKKYQKYVNTELDSCFCKLASHYTPVVEAYVPFIKVSGSFEVNNGLVTVKPGQRVQIGVVINYSGSNTAANIGYQIKDFTNNIVIHNFRPYRGGLESEFNYTQVCQYTNETDNDCEIGLYITAVSKTDTLSSSFCSMTAQEISRAITIDPVEHINTTQGIEDVPVGHIISHMGTVAPKHYLTCNGSEYNIEDYPYLAQHFKDNFGSINYFGGDGITTFAIPNKNNLYTESVPAMKSNNSPFPYVVSASSNYSGRPPYYAFNKTNSNVSDLWTCLLNDNNPWIQIYSPDGVNISKFSITSRNGDNTATGYRPKIISLVGSDNEVDWVTLLDTTEVTWNGSNQTLEFILDNMYKFKYIRLYLYSNNKYTEIGRFDIYKTENIQCIKCEPTYFMNTYNTNYMQPSLYSEEERIVGCWIDGKPLYEKTIKFLVNGNTVYSHNIQNVDYIFIKNFVLTESSRMFYTQNSIDAYVTTNQVALNVNSWNVSDEYAYTVLQYTKITDEENSFTESMLKESFIKLDSTCTDEELQQAILDMVEEINAEEVTPEVIDEPETEVTEGGQV